MKRSRAASQSSGSPSSKSSVRGPSGSAVADTASGKGSAMDKGKEKESPKAPSPSSPDSSPFKSSLESKKKELPLIKHLIMEAHPTEKRPHRHWDTADCPAKFKPVPGQTYELVLPKMRIETTISQLSDDDISDGPDDEGLSDIEDMAENLRVAIVRRRRRGLLYTEEGDGW
ncbi:unnamed protein product [Urochloa humidicola]